MTTDAYGQFLRYYVAESAAATLTEGNAILTGSTMRMGGNAVAIEIHHILGSLSYPEDVPATTAVEYTRGAIATRSSLSSMPNLDEEYLIYKTGISLKGGVATYVPLIQHYEDMPSYTVFDPPILLSHSKLYPYVQSSNSSAAATFKGYLFYFFVDISGDLAVEALEVFR